MSFIPEMYCQMPLKYVFLFHKIDNYGSDTFDGHFVLIDICLA